MFFEGREPSAVLDDLTWHGYQVRCSRKRCGSSGPWQLYVGDVPGYVGDFVSLVCPAGHDQQHPLVYPQMVRQAAAWAAVPTEPAGAFADQRAGFDATFPGWAPHVLQWSEKDALDHAATLRVSYQPWTATSAPPSAWDASWPGLTTAALVAGLAAPSDSVSPSAPDPSAGRGGGSLDG